MSPGSISAGSISAASISAASTTKAEQQRDRFYRIVPQLLADNESLALVLAEIGAGYIDAPASVADRIVNVGIREQLMVGVAGGMALTGMRPIVHSFAPFVVERPYEQVKLDLGYQGVGAVLVSAGGSYDSPAMGQTHFGPRDVALLDTLSEWTVHVPGHPDEAEALLRNAVAAEGRVYIRLDGASNMAARDVSDGRMQVLRRGRRGTVVAVGPMADRALQATLDLDVTVLYAATVRPFDGELLRATLGDPDVVLVEPYLRGTSVGAVAAALADVRHRVLGLGVSHRELRRYGNVAAEHDALHGLDVPGIRRSVVEFLRQ